MSQAPNTILNGPEGEITMAFSPTSNRPDDKTNKPVGNLQQQQQQQQQPPNGQFVRPPLQRVDSRANLQPRPPFQNPQFRPLQNRPQYPINAQFPQRPQSPRPNLQFPNPAARPPLPPQRPQNVRFQSRSPGIFQQGSLPSPTISKEEFFQRSQTLDLQENKIENAGGDFPEAERPPMRARSMSQCSNSELPITTDTRRSSVSSISSIDEKKAAEEVPIRPESRNQMKKIEEEVKSVKVEEEDDKASPPKTLSLNNSESKQSISPSPQNDSVIENKCLSKDESKSIKSPSPTKSPTPKKEGDNDSGVDESTQGNDHSSNGEQSSPRKAARNVSRLTTPTKNRSFSRGSRSPNLKSPDSTPSTPGTAEKKKLPMNKIQVGSAPSPNLKVVKSKIGSLANTSHKPGGGHIKIEHKKIDLSHTQSKIGAKNHAYVPSGGDKKIVNQKLQWNAKSKIGSLENTTHKPKGGDKKIETVKLDFKDKAKSKVGSKDNIKYVPGGGDVKSDVRDFVKEEPKRVIETKKINLKVESKIGSLDNVKYKPGGGDKKIFDDKEYLRQMSGLSNEDQSVSGSQNSLPSHTSDAREPISDENLNREN